MCSQMIQEKLDLLPDPQRDAIRIAFGESFFEISAEAEMASVDHERIYVTPDFAEIRNGADFAIEIRDGWNWDIGANLL